MNNEQRFNACKAIKTLIDNPLFEDAVSAIRADLGEAMLDADVSEDRDDIYNENQGLERLLDKLRSMANEAVMAEGESKDLDNA
jgi:hypothetical protein